MNGATTGPGEGRPERESFERFLEEAVRDYRRPPETPRDAIWEGILARRGQGADREEEPWAEALRDYHRPPATPRARIWERVRQLRAPASARTTGTGGDAWLPRMFGREDGLRTLAAAAVLLLAAGMAWWAAPPSSEGPAPEGLPVAVAPTRGDPGPEPAPGTTAAGTPEGTARRGAEIASPERAGSPDGTPPTALPARETRPGAGGPAAPDASGEMARWVARGLLDRADLMLTSLRTGVGEGAVERRRLRRWAGEVLVTTRLLLDSPLAEDPEMGRLLSDLELILARIRSLPAMDGPDDELQLLREDLQEADVIPRLRSTVAEGSVGRES